ncbi:hypothetical protein [Vreelandella massiliensis]|uniref:hypothetical protein n=1 Tax=Vreelandella massiliensis TaxID=1816686 RepID=UPI00096A2436|nr:hypothetical protein [Halomonas massiliensis]
MAVFNHLFSIAFSLNSYAEDGNDITPAQIRRALLERLASVDDSELLEAIGAPEDTYEEDKLFCVTITKTIGEHQVDVKAAVAADNEDDAIERAIEDCAQADELEPAGLNRWWDCGGDILLKAKTVIPISTEAYRLLQYNESL